MSYILCDVEGTTTDIQFVHQKLFPFAAQRIEGFFKEHPTQLKLSANALSCSKEDVVLKLKKMIEDDVKDAELKRVQGLIWKEGYSSGKLKGHVYGDVLPAFEHWVASGYRIGIYSSGSIQAQKLIYGHSVAGDLTHFLSDHFDLGVGYKYEASSYQNICLKLQMEASDVLFLSDVEAELDAASSVGMKTVRLFRDGVEETAHRFAEDFQQVQKLLDQESF
ncbi:MAG: acireductone synthase [Proteobacteria bacterium]|nr:acireductone synthase [Pseudomonadota bacterium]